jgi:serine/threonine-protein kinase
VIPSNRPVLQPGATFDGQYRLHRFLRDGPAGPVWEAERVEGGATVALQLLEAFGGLADPQSRTRARQTIRSVAWPWFRHPHAAALLRFGGDRMPSYAATEPPAGETVRDRLRRSGPMASDEAARVVADVAEAVQAAHQLGVAHGAIDPDAVMVTGDGGGQLLDLGLTPRSWQVSSPRTPGAASSPPDPAFASATAADVAALGALLRTMTRDQPSARPGGANVAPLAPRTWGASETAGELAAALRGTAPPSAPEAPATGEPAAPPGAPAPVPPVARTRARWPWIAAAAVLVLVGAALGAFALARSPGRTAAPPRASAPPPPTAATPSAAPGTVVVPELRGLSAAEAQRALLDAGLTLSTVRPVQGTPGAVVGSDPGTGAVVGRGSAVALLVGAEAGRIPPSASP